MHFSEGTTGRSKQILISSTQTSEVPTLKGGSAEFEGLRQPFEMPLCSLRIQPQ
jgi:hypothetical protein